ncbi:MAG: hypothetical protein Fur0035_06810 [Anaerolineales bacterium]
MKTRLSPLHFLLILTLTACSAAKSSPTPLPTLALQAGTPPPSAASPASGGVSASGVVVAAEEASLAFGAAGRLSRLYAAEGDLVKAGDLLAELENASLQADLALAQRALKEMTSPAAIAAAELSLANAQKAQQQAQDKAAGLNFSRASDTRLENLQAEIDLAKQALARAQDAYRSVARLPDGDSKKAAATYAMTQAQLNLNNLLAEYNYLTGSPSASDAAIVRANLDAANAAAQEAAWYLAVLQGESLPAEATGASLAALEAARAAVQRAQERLDASRLVSPLNGQIIRVTLHSGEYAQPGLPVILVSNTSALQVQTTDLSERDVLRVQVGGAARVSVRALGETISGVVLKISPLASALGGDVVYQTTIQLEKPYPPGLRAGMSVIVTFE